MKLTVEIEGENYSLDFRREDTRMAGYVLQAAGESSTIQEAAGTASIAETMPGVYSVLLGTKSFTISLVQGKRGLEVWASGRRLSVSVSDTRDLSRTHAASGSGPLELRAQMPGKIIKVLVEAGMRVQAGQELVVVEAMKMQNEMRSPREGVISNVYVAEGSTVAAGETLVVVE